jgi:hypothetical protein
VCQGVSIRTFTAYMSSGGCSGHADGAEGCLPLCAVCANAVQQMG